MNQEPPSGSFSPRPNPAIVPPQHKHRRHAWVWVVVLAAFGLLFYWVITQHNKAQAAVTGGGRRGVTGPVPVTTATARTGSINVYLGSIGTVTPVYMASITAQVTGVITAVHYREGQYVKKGDPLIDIDPRQYAAQLAEAQGLLERDQNLLAEAKMDLERYQEAWKKNAIPRQTLEDQEKIVLQDQGTVKNDQGTLRYDQVQVAYCHITAPISGRVGLRLVDPGNLVTANATTTLVVITETQPITVVATISEDNLAEVMAQPHHGINLPLDAWDRANQNKIASGKVTSYDNQIDTTTGTIKLRAQFENKKGELYPNEFVNTRLLVKTLPDQILLPNSAIQHNGNTAFVYLIQNGQAVMRTVKTGASDGGKTAVQGVNEGDVVADSSFDKLQNGSKVNITATPPPPTSSPEGNAP